jgi:DNA-binding PadR family transcriptional regulator
MARRRTVNNLMALAVLSTLWTRPMHRYEMASVMRARGKDQDMAVKWGSLYTVVDNMAKHGLVEVVSTDRQGARPERTVYRITDAGRAELLDWTRELLADPEPERTRFAAGLSVMSALQPDEAADLLRVRLRKLQDVIAAQQESLDTAAAEIPRLFLVEDEYRLVVLRAEADWIGQLIVELTDGSFPDVDRWRSWHTSGDLPADLAALAEKGATPE